MLNKRIKCKSSVTWQFYSQYNRLSVQFEATLSPTVVNILSFKDFSVMTLISCDRVTI